MDLSYQEILLVPLVMSISELLKMIGINPKLIPIVNIILGLIGGLVYLNPYDLKLGILQGIIIGLTSSGLYSSVKNINESRR